MSLNERFSRLSVWMANALGSAWLFVANLGLILLWLAIGPLAHFSETWQLFINTTTTVLTYLAVFLIQNTQNRDMKSLQLKLNELISSTDGARNMLVNLETLTDEQLDELQREFARLQNRVKRGQIAAEASIKMQGNTKSNSAGSA